MKPSPNRPNQPDRRCPRVPPGLAILPGLWLLAACGGETRQVKLVASAGACAGVVRLEVILHGVASGSDVSRRLLMDPLKASCDFGQGFELDHVQPGSGRFVTVTGRDSAGQLVVSGESAAFDDPSSGAITSVPVARTGVAPKFSGVALFSLPRELLETKQIAYLSVGHIVSPANPLVDLHSPDGTAWVGPDAKKQYFAVTRIETGLASGGYIQAYLFSSERVEQSLLRCTLGGVEQGSTYPFLCPTKSSDDECEVLTPTKCPVVP